MALQISSWAIRRPIPIIVLFFLLTVAGILAFQKLPVNANPNVSFPIVNVSIRQNLFSVSGTDAADTS